jgi:hypothetical protein
LLTKSLLLKICLLKNCSFTYVDDSLTRETARALVRGTKRLSVVVYIRVWIQKIAAGVEIFIYNDDGIFTSWNKHKIINKKNIHYHNVCPCLAENKNRRFQHLRNDMLLVGILHYYL